MVIAVDISNKARGKTPGHMLGALNQSIAIMGQKLGQAELARADVVIRPQVLDMGPVDFNQRTQAIAEGEGRPGRHGADPRTHCAAAGRARTGHAPGAAKTHSEAARQATWMALAPGQTGRRGRPGRLLRTALNYANNWPRPAGIPPAPPSPRVMHAVRAA